jgi:hypothetical protein
VYYYAFLAWFSGAVEFLADRFLNRQTVFLLCVCATVTAVLRPALGWLSDLTVILLLLLFLLWLLDNRIRREQEGSGLP